MLQSDIFSDSGRLSAAGDGQITTVSGPTFAIPSDSAERASQTACSNGEEINLPLNELAAPATYHAISSLTADNGRFEGTRPASPLPQQKRKVWKPTPRTWHVIELMQQGLSNDDIAARKDVEVETSAANLRKIRQRARDNRYLSALESEKRDRPSDCHASP